MITGGLSNLLTWPALNSAGSESLLSLFPFKSIDQASPSASELQLSIASFQMSIKSNIGFTVGELMLFPSLDLKSADIILPLTLQRASFYYL